MTIGQRMKNDEDPKEEEQAKTPTRNVTEFCITLVRGHDVCSEPDSIVIQSSREGYVYT